jgi:hypothetical protein
MFSKRQSGKVVAVVKNGVLPIKNVRVLAAVLPFVELPPVLGNEVPPETPLAPPAIVLAAVPVAPPVFAAVPPIAVAVLPPTLTALVPFPLLAHADAKAVAASGDIVANRSMYRFMSFPRM